METQAKVALVTGGASRLGGFISKHLLSLGYRTWVHYHTGLHEAKELEQQGAKLQRADFTSLVEVSNLAKKLIKEERKLDILIHNAAFYDEKPFVEASEQDWDHTFAINTKSPFFLTQELLPLIQKSGAGQIVCILDDAIWKPYKNHSIYSMTKGSLWTGMLSWSRELAPAIRVNGIAPGAISPTEEMTAEMQEKIAAQTLLKKWGNPQEIVNTVDFLLRQEYMTGTVIHVNGGRHLV